MNRLNYISICCGEYNIEGGIFNLFKETPEVKYSEQTLKGNCIQRSYKYSVNVRCEDCNISFSSFHSAMNDLLQTMAVAGVSGSQWMGSTENLDGPEAGDARIVGSSGRSGQRMKELALSTNAIDCAALTLPSARNSRAKLRLQVKGKKKKPR